MDNSELAELLNRVADAYELQGVEWKPAAYRKAANSVQNLEQDLLEIYRFHGIKGLIELPGIGKAIAEHIIELLETGHSKKIDSLLKKVSQSHSEIMQLEGVGPKKAYKLIEELQLSSIAELKAAAQQGKIRVLKGFGEKTESNILRAIEMHLQGKKRRPFAEMLKESQSIIDYLKQHAVPQKIDYAGSLRRRKDTVGDIDILVCTAQPEELMKTFTSMPRVDHVLAHGSTKSSVVLNNGVQVDLRAVPEQSYAAALLYFTGSKEHNIRIRALANRKGYLLSEYGLFTLTDKKPIACNSEKSIYKQLGLHYIPPELREVRGKFEATTIASLPVLVEQADLKGDLHTHTTFSDGNSSLQAMVQRAQDMGYSYIAITDHSISARIANGLSLDRLKAQWEEIDNIAAKFKIRILKGAEVDILKDGKLDYPDEILEQLHVVIGAIHSSFKMPASELIHRLTRALLHPCLDILAHPSCRLIGRRGPLQIDYKQVFKVAASNNKILEINSQPSRMDLHDTHILQARDSGVKFCINTDGHGTDEFAFMGYGIGLARRAWLTKNDVINTLPLSKLRRYLPRIPQ